MRSSTLQHTGLGMLIFGSIILSQLPPSATPSTKVIVGILGATLSLGGFACLVISWHKDAQERPPAQ